MQRLKKYLTNGIISHTLQTIGAEIETQFVDSCGNPISMGESQAIFLRLIERGWYIDGYNGDFITSLTDSNANRIFYELGWHNIEISTAVSDLSHILDVINSCLGQLYNAAEAIGGKPYFAPILRSDDDLLVIPDERDKIWVELDGRSALAPLALVSSIQFTFSVDPCHAIEVLNKLGEKIGMFLDDYPQDKIWKQYISNSKARYLPDRYGGQLLFESFDNYCQSLVRHDVVCGSRLVPYREIHNLDIALYLRSIWWHFRLKRYSNALCIEVRPMARRADVKIKSQLEKILNIIC